MLRYLHIRFALIKGDFSNSRSCSSSPAKWAKRDITYKAAWLVLFLIQRFLRKFACFRILATIEICFRQVRGRFQIVRLLIVVFLELANVPRFHRRLAADGSGPSSSRYAR